MVVVLGLAFLMSAILTIYLLFRSGDTQVPNLVGRPEIEAKKMAEKAGLKVRVQRRNDQSVPTDTVIETRPLPNSYVKKDSGLTIIISNGPATSGSLLINNLEIQLSKIVLFSDNDHKIYLSGGHSRSK